ncbi:MAG: trehalose-phosphatase [Bacillota bacterium]
MDFSADAANSVRLYLFLDYDGTLVPIAPTPDEAVPPPELLRLLHTLVGRDGLRVAIISGRGLKNLQEMLPVPGLYLSACHGAIIQHPGAPPRFLAAPTALEQLDHLTEEAQELIEGRTGFQIERKEMSVALHYRLADPDEVDTVLDAFLDLREQYCPDLECDLLAGRKVLEVRPKGVSKGTAVKILLAACPDALPVYIGDDVTDEDAFRALSGRGLTILVADARRATTARRRLTRPAVLDLLRGVAEHGPGYITSPDSLPTPP